MIFQKVLLNELNTRQIKNPLYSLRAFARAIEISPTLLSQLFSGDRNLTKRSAQLICKNLDLDHETAQKILLEVEGSKLKIQKKIDANQVRLSVEQFRIISDWEHFAVLALADIKDNIGTTDWIAGRLGISRNRAEEVLQRLIRLNYIQIKKHKMVKKTDRIETTRDIPSAAIRKFHRQNLDKAALSLQNNDVSERYFGSTTIAIDKEDLPKFKKLLRSFRAKFEKFAEKSNPRQVYHFSIQLFPIDQNERNLK